ncbi:PAS domain-containing sensor histidine kinase [Anaerosporomusa subterranea]|uniref:histidine kinase n=1 Tax=Anaerosporomusa subterranea TaxID=1794912 RepID=A0A154BVC3_ANASB|nr:ATP-binding protein [Anaerosporomusa subterranea]KYZ77973.1 PAS domain-containing sensor histidine kinase [Anaerosporomusa subterranea]
MNFFTMSIFGTIIVTTLMILIFVYLYALYRERYIGYWIVSWGFLLLRTVLFDSGMLDWMQSIAWFTIYQMLTFSALIVFIWSIHLFIDKPLVKWWIYSGLGASLLTFIFTIIQLPIAYKLLPPAWFAGITGIWLSITFMRQLKLNRISKQILGSTFILWGLHSLDMPFLIDVAWFAPWGYFIDSILRLLIAMSTLLVYFEKTRADLVSKEAQYRLLAENSADIIYRYRLLPEAKFEYVSPAVFPITGYTPEEYYADAKLLFNLIHPDDSSQFYHFFNNKSSTDTFPLSFRLIRKDQRMIWIEQTCVPIYANDGKIQVLEGNIRDITSRKHLEQIASRVDRLNTVGEMAASVAHEIRNPMTTVRGYLQLLVSKKEFSHYQDRFELMIQELDRTNTIIREYLCLAKDKRSDLKCCCLNSIVKSLFPLMQADAIASAIDITHDLDEIPELYLDENEIRQLLLNLVRNGLEAMSSGGSLNIRTFMDKNKVILSVSDQGSGVPEHILNNLGTPFLTTKDNGTGLGLPMCYRIAHRHQADIKVETSFQGTTFFVGFSLPTAPI